MEEIRSTEALDREILEDARKKAQRILKTAEENLEAQNRDWEKKIRDSVDAVRDSYAERTKRIREETFARLPLDKRRLRSETAEKLLVKAMDDFLRGLPRERLLAVLDAELAERFKVCFDGGKSPAPESESPETKTAAGAGRPRVSFSGMSLSEAEALVRKAAAALASKTYAHSLDWDFREAPGRPEFPSVIIDTEALRIHVSAENAAAFLLREKRAELTGALLGGEVLND